MSFLISQHSQTLAPQLASPNSASYPNQNNLNEAITESFSHNQVLIKPTVIGASCLCKTRTLEAEGETQPTAGMSAVSAVSGYSLPASWRRGAQVSPLTSQEVKFSDPITFICLELVVLSTSIVVN